MTGLNVWISVFSIGVVCTFYTTLVSNETRVGMETKYSRPLDSYLFLIIFFGTLQGRLWSWVLFLCKRNKCRNMGKWEDFYCGNWNVGHLPPATNIIRTIVIESTLVWLVPEIHFQKIALYLWPLSLSWYSVKLKELPFLGARTKHLDQTSTLLVVLQASKFIFVTGRNEGCSVDWCLPDLYHV